MKLFVVLGVIVGLYTYVMMHTTDIVLNQTQHLQTSYQYVADNADKIAAGK